jgi:hypothetical protein
MMVRATSPASRPDTVSALGFTDGNLDLFIISLEAKACLRMEEYL